MAIKKFLTKSFPIIAILAIASGLRFYRLDALTTFGGDQGYDFAVVRTMALDKKPTLLGPKIGPYNQLGNLYLGPAYYYLLFPSLKLAGYDPIGPAIMTVIFSIGTIFLLYIICLKYLSFKIALISAFIYSINPFLISQSRAASNPHLLPLFSALTLLSIFKFKIDKSKNIAWPLIAGISCGIAFQLHYLALILFLIAVSIFFRAWKLLLVLVTGFALSISPQIIFELRHNFFVTNLLLGQFSSAKNILSGSGFLIHLKEGFLMIASLLIGDSNTVAVIILVGFLLIITFFKNTKKRFIFVVLTTLIISNLVTSALYSGKVMPHYLASSYLATIALVSLAIYQLFNLSRNIIIRAVFTLIIAQVMFTNLIKLDIGNNQGYTMPQGWDLIGIRQVSKIIARDISGTQSFNIAATLDGDTRAMPYRYLVDVYGRKAQPVENYGSIDVLYLISRDENEKILQYTVWEVDSFKPFKISAQWQIQNGVRLLKLQKIHESYK